MILREVLQGNNKNSDNSVHLQSSYCRPGVIFLTPPQHHEVRTVITPILQIRQWRHNRDQSHKCKEVKIVEGRWGGSVSRASGFSSGHDLTACELEPRVGLCADSSEPGARFGFRVSARSEERL